MSGNWDKGDNGILYLSSAYKLKPGSGWDVLPGILHALWFLIDAEPQRASDVFAMLNPRSGICTHPDLLVKDVPEEYKHDLDYIVNMLDWEANVDPNFYAN